jgi:hypothetical protein
MFCVFNVLTKHASNNIWYVLGQSPTRHSYPISQSPTTHHNFFFAAAAEIIFSIFFHFHFSLRRSIAHVTYV